MVEFALVAVPIVFLLLTVLQVAAYLHLRNVVVASAAEGARYAANADRDVAAGGPFAEQVLAQGVSRRTASGIRCNAGEVAGPDATLLVAVRCEGAVPTFLSVLGALLPVDVTARALEEGA